MTQSSRTSTMKSIKEGQTKILIATDIASRGVDISELSHVFNFHVADIKIDIRTV